MNLQGKIEIDQFKRRLAEMPRDELELFCLTQTVGLSILTQYSSVPEFVVNVTTMAAYLEVGIPLEKIRAIQEGNREQDINFARRVKEIN